MTRLLSTMKLDAAVQFRNKFYYIGIGLALVIAAILAAFFEHESLGQMIPIFFLFAIGGSTLLYVAGLVIFEKDEHTMDAMLVSPLRLNEYMASKVITLTLLVIVESLLAVALSYGLGGFNPLLLIGGIALMAIMLTLIGFVLVVRYDTITDFLIPVLVVGLVLQLPFIQFLGIWENPIWYLIPTSAPTVLMLGAWRPLETWELVYGLGYSLLLIGFTYRWALSAFNTYIVMKERG